LTPTDPNQNTNDEGTPLNPHPQRVTANKWLLTSQALEKLLCHFSSNPEEAGKQYELMRLKLMRYYEWRACPGAEDLADEAINRVARRLDEGQQISNLPAYFSTVARLIFMESLRQRERTSVSLDEVPDVPADPTDEDEKDMRLDCLDQCLESLTRESRTLILKYYRDDRRAKIDQRRKLADEMAIPMNALRIRAHRVRLTLEQCVRDCVAQTV